MANVDQGDHEREIAILLEIAVNHLGPTHLLGFRDLGVSVPRKVYEMRVFGIKEIDGRRLARLRRNLGKLLAVEKLIEQG